MGKSQLVQAIGYQAIKAGGVDAQAGQAAEDEAGSGDVKACSNAAN